MENMGLEMEIRLGRALEKTPSVVSIFTCLGRPNPNTLNQNFCVPSGRGHFLASRHLTSPPTTKRDPAAARSWQSMVCSLERSSAGRLSFPPKTCGFVSCWTPDPQKRAMSNRRDHRRFDRMHTFFFPLFRVLLKYICIKKHAFFQGSIVFSW